MCSQSNKEENMLWGEKRAVDALNQPDDSMVGDLCHSTQTQN